MFEKEIFGQRLLALRKEKKISQTALGQLLGVTATQIRDIERGKSTTSMGRLYQLCQYFNVSSDYFLGLTDNPEPRDQSVNKRPAGIVVPCEETPMERKKSLLDNPLKK